jgi:hypothetical protein
METEPKDVAIGGLGSLTGHPVTPTKAIPFTTVNIDAAIRSAGETVRTVVQNHLDLDRAVYSQTPGGGVEVKKVDNKSDAP